MSTEKETLAAKIEAALRKIDPAEFDEDDSRDRAPWLANALAEELLK